MFLSILILLRSVHHARRTTGRSACGVQLRGPGGPLSPSPLQVGARGVSDAREEGCEVFAVGPKAGVKYTGKHSYPVTSDRGIDDVKVHAPVSCLFRPKILIVSSSLAGGRLVCISEVVC
jgi:hypothetical protein